MAVTSVRRGCTTWLLAFLACLAGCAANPINSIWYPPTSAWQRGVTDGIELLNKDDTIRRVDAHLVHTLYEVLEKLQTISDVKAQLALADTDAPNAFAFERRGQPHIAISLSFLDVLGHDSDALATTLGHELAHVHLGHRAARAQRTQLAHTAVQGVGTLLSLVGMPLGGVVAGLGMSGLHAAYSRDEEREADSLGLAWAVAAGFDACGAYRTLQTLEKAGNHSRPIPFLAMHPHAQERMSNADARSMEATRHACSAAARVTQADQ